MAELTYVVPTKPRRPFNRGDLVDVMDREGTKLYVAAVVRAGPKIARTNCGRRWTQDGWRLRDRAYPFPWIKHSRSKKVG